jgi:hypothetical protein
MLPSFRTPGGHSRFSGRTFDPPQIPDFAQRVDEPLQDLE